MALSYVRSVASGSTDTFSVPFPYLDKSHVYVSIDGVELAPSAFTWPSDGSVKITAGNPTAGAIVERRRRTPDDPLVTFAPGNLEAADLNTGVLQPLFLAQEARDVTDDSGGRGWYTADLGPGGTITKGLELDLVVFDANGNIVPGSSLGFPAFGDSASRNVGTTAGTVAAGDDSRFSLAESALQPGDSVQDLEFLSPVTNAEPRGTQTRLRETYHIRDFHRAEDGDDYTNTIARWQSFVSGSINSPKLLITDGVYEHTNGGNWAKSNAEIKSDGSGRLRNLGTGDNFIVDAGNTDNIWNMLVEGNLLLEGGASSGHGARIRAIHHSEIGSLNVRGCGAAKAGIYMEFGVCSRLIRPIVSLNEGAWYDGAQPLYGLQLERRTGSVDPSPVAFSHVENPVIEHVQYGANLVNALGVRISNGTIEGCTAGGLVISTDSNENVIDRVNFEANNGFDIYCEGDNNEFQSVYSLGQLRDGPGVNDGLNLNGSARGNKVIGGVFNGIRLGASTFDNLLMGVAYNRYGNAVTPLNDLGTRNRMVGLYDMTNTVWHDAKRQRTVLTLTGSPFTYANTTANPEVVIINGGTVSAIDYINAGVGDTTGETHGTFYLFPGGALQIAYSSAPTVIVQRG